MTRATLAQYLLRSEKNGVIEIKLPQKAFHAAHWLLSQAFDQGNVEDGIDPAYIDRVVGVASAAQFDQEARNTLCHMGMPHPAEPWDMRHREQYSDRT